ncbi:hypothetical protein FPF71_06680 [Algibacter amylolyticus]|uniref:Glycosyltransferase family 4 protein n=1 Tax=Algibacter amylolyticus TaxID=1608400 RepID=A0A5M7BBF6_9FLAO|nr:hypothetical protein [Algibacter amylolyticus]KAA5825587.1 hypothetical protein F2B50_06680 [Algibacter amylolyticus]MBB5268187.1 competence CoiA-like predicted nuclease [Algibacter amylolyticus]TSJ79885.1 hypothetical protein FPF71_06680 [Algibacter amylolyticus]
MNKPLKILIASNIINNSYIPSLFKAYTETDNKVFSGVTNFFQTNIIPDILHLQWPESLYKFGDFSLFGDAQKSIQDRLTFFKKNGVYIIWTIHNIQPHDSKDNLKDAAIYNLFIEFSDLIVHHGNTSIELMNNNWKGLKDKKHIVCPHGDYSIQYKSISKEKARNELGLPLDKKILMHFGYLRGYKGYNQLPKIFKGWKAKNKYLFTAGQIISDKKIQPLIFRLWYGKIRKRTKKFGYDIKLIRNDKIAYYFNAVDYVIITHTKGLNSGIIPMALTFNIPIIYPDLGNFKEQAMYSISSCYKPGDTESATRALNKLTKNIESIKSIDNSKWQEHVSWEKHVKLIIESYRDFIKLK